MARLASEACKTNSGGEALPFLDGEWLPGRHPRGGKSPQCSYSAVTRVFDRHAPSRKSCALEGSRSTGQGFMLLDSSSMPRLVYVAFSRKEREKKEDLGRKQVT